MRHSTLILAAMVLPLTASAQDSLDVNAIPIDCATALNNGFNEHMNAPPNWSGRRSAHRKLYEDFDCHKRTGHEWFASIAELERRLGPPPPPPDTTDIVPWVVNDVLDPFHLPTGAKTVISPPAYPGAGTLQHYADAQARVISTCDGINFIRFDGAPPLSTAVNYKQVQGGLPLVYGYVKLDRATKRDGTFKMSKWAFAVPPQDSFFEGIALVGNETFDGTIPLEAGTGGLIFGAIANAIASRKVNKRLADASMAEMAFSMSGEGYVPWAFDMRGRAYAMSQACPPEY